MKLLPAADKTFGKLDRQQQRRIRKFIENERRRVPADETGVDRLAAANPRSRSTRFKSRTASGCAG